MNFLARNDYNLEQRAFWSENKGILLASLVTFVVVLLARSWPHYVNPGLYVEDTTHYFNFFYGDIKSWEALLHNPNGYYNLLNNFLGMVVAKFDVRIQPYMYLWIATILSVAAVMVLPASGLLKNKYILFAAPLLLGLSGLNHLFYYVTLTYQIYVLVILLLGLLFWEPFKNNISNIFLFVVLSLLIWSGPYSVLVVPFSLLYIVFFRGRTLFLLGLCVVTVLYTMSVTEHMILMRNLFKPVIHQVWFDVLVGKVFFMGMMGGTGPKKIIILCVFFGAVIALLRKDYLYLKVAVLLFVLMNSTLAALFLSKKFMLAWRILPCYVVIAQFFWLFFLLFTADRLLQLRQGFRHVGLVVAVLALVFVVRDNQLHPDKGRVPIMTALPEFLETVHEQEQVFAQNPDKVIIVNYAHASGKPNFRPKAIIGKGKEEQLPKKWMLIREKKE